MENETFCADIERVRRTDRLKTGELICAAAQMGCIAAKATAEQMQAAQEYAHSIGLAFQITDDILDCVGDVEQLGKPTGSGGKTTRPPMCRCTAYREPLNRHSSRSCWQNRHCRDWEKAKTRRQPPFCTGWQTIS